MLLDPLNILLITPCICTKGTVPSKSKESSNHQHGVYQGNSSSHIVIL